jgi:hypothetical protein
VCEGVCVCVYVCVRYHNVEVYYVYCHTVPARRVRCVRECV